MARLLRAFFMGLAVFSYTSARVVNRNAQSDIRRYTLTVTQDVIMPDGVSRSAYLINNQTPGPHIAIDEGDHVEIVVNNLTPVGITIHWHGIEQRNTTASDGVPGVTQSLIDPKKSFTYKWTATQSGSYWYHAHSRALYDDGIRGTLSIRPRISIDTPFHLISSDENDVKAMIKADQNSRYIAVNEWKHQNSTVDLNNWERTGIEQLCADSILVNGKGQVICPTQSTLAQFVNPLIPAFTPKGCAYPNNSVIQPFNGTTPGDLDPSIFFTCKNTSSPLSVITVDPSEQWVSVTFLNLGSLWEEKVSIDGHKLWVYAADGQYHQPQAVDVVSVPSGERFQAMIKLDQPHGDYTIRVSANVLPQVISGFAVFSYTSSKTFTEPPKPFNPSMNYGGVLANGSTLLDPSTLHPYPSSLTPPQKSDVTFKFDLNRTSDVNWALNEIPYPIATELETPILFNPSIASTLNPDLVSTYQVGDVVDIVLISAPGNPPHPIHKHGVKAWIIGQGAVPFEWDSVEEAIAAQPKLFNLIDPPLRDGFNTPPAITSPAFMVIRYQPAWPAYTFMHCHINSHLFGGMGHVLIEGTNVSSTVHF